MFFDVYELLLLTINDCLYFLMAYFVAVYNRNIFLMTIYDA